MDSVLVLMAAPGSGAITEDVVEALRDHGAGDHIGWPKARLAKSRPFRAGPSSSWNCADMPIDAAIVSIHNRRKRLLLADMDSTMIHQECIDELGRGGGRG